MPLHRLDLHQNHGPWRQYYHPLPGIDSVIQTLKTEIARISRKEMKPVIQEISRSNKSLRKTVSELKNRVTHLERENKRLKALQAKQQAATPPIKAEDGKRARLTSKGVRSLRKRTGLSLVDFAKLCGTSPQTVFLWERKDGALKLRDKTRAALLSIRGLGAREAKRRLADGQEEAKKRGTGGRRKRKQRRAKV